MVYVLAHDNTPLMPCLPVVARLLMKQGKAKCKTRTPFVIKLQHETTKYVQETTLGVDTSSGTLGAAVVSEKHKCKKYRKRIGDI